LATVTLNPIHASFAVLRTRVALKYGAPVELWVTPGVAPGSIPRQTDDSELGGGQWKLRSFSPMP
jgi:hypothetical protein